MARLAARKEWRRGARPRSSGPRKLSGLEQRVFYPSFLQEFILPWAKRAPLETIARQERRRCQDRAQARFWEMIG